MSNINLEDNDFNKKTIIRRIAAPILVIIVIIIIGTSWYSIIEGWSVLDAMYMTVITVTTIGFREVHQLDDSGKAFTIFLAIAGVGAAMYALSAFISIGVGGHLIRTFKGKQMINELKKYKNHVILCGCGQMGECALKELLIRGTKVVVIDNNSETLERLAHYKIPIIQNDATLENVLENAGIKSAYGLIASLPDDADNLFLTLTAREMVHELFIIARASNSKIGKKLKRAGANKIILANEVSGRHMANIILSPEAMNFVDKITGLRNRQFGLREIILTNECGWTGKSIAEANLRANTGLNILAVRQGNEELLINPTPQTILNEGDLLIVFGPIDAAEKLNVKFKKQV